MSGPSERLRAAEWIERCAAELIRADPDLDASAAESLANDMFQFPRTAAMTPEAAVQFVAHQLAQEAPRFERRLQPR